MLLHLRRMSGHGEEPRVKNGPALAGHGAGAVRDAIAASIVTLPDQLRRSLTWDQGAEMAEHAQLRIDTGVEIYFCDPHSPWQRGIVAVDLASPAAHPTGRPGATPARRTAPAAARTRVGNRSGGYAASAIADAEPILITRSGTADQNATIRSVTGERCDDRLNAGCTQRSRATSTCFRR